MPHESADLRLSCSPVTDRNRLMMAQGYVRQIEVAAAVLKDYVPFNLDDEAVAAELRVIERAVRRIREDLGKHVVVRVRPPRPELLQRSIVATI